MVFSLEKVFKTPVINKSSCNDSAELIAGQNSIQAKAKAPDIISTSHTASLTGSAIVFPVKALAPSTDKALRAMLDNRPLPITKAVTRESPNLRPADQPSSAKLLEKLKSSITPTSSKIVSSGSLSVSLPKQSSLCTSGSLSVEVSASPASKPVKSPVYEPISSASNSPEKNGEPKESTNAGFSLPSMNPPIKSPPSSTNQLPSLKENRDPVKPRVQPDTKAPSVRKCTVCRKPLRGHQGPTGVGKCVNTLVVKSFIEDINKSEEINYDKFSKQQYGYIPLLPGSTSSSFLNDLETIGESLSVPDNMQRPIIGQQIMAGQTVGVVARTVAGMTRGSSPQIIMATSPAGVRTGGQIIVQGAGGLSRAMPGQLVMASGGQLRQGGLDVPSPNTDQAPGSSSSVSGQVSGSTTVSMSNILGENVSSSLEVNVSSLFTTTMEGSVSNSLQGKVSKKRKVSGELKLKKKKKKTNGSAFEYFRPMQEWQNFFARENLMTISHQPANESSVAQVSENHGNVRTDEIESTAVITDTSESDATRDRRHQVDVQVLAQDRVSLHVPLQRPTQAQGYPQPALHGYRAPAHLPPARPDQQAAAGVAALHAVQHQNHVTANTRNKVGRGRPVRKCNLGECSFCSIKENCGLCKYCTDPKLKAKCSVRQCPRLNKRHCHPSKSTVEVERILNDLVNDVCDRNEDHEEHITMEGDNFEQRVEEESVVPKVKGNMREVWICPICSVHVRHRQNIARHQSVNCSAVKVPKLKPVPVPKPESRCEICGVIFLCKTSLTAHMKRLHMEFYCQINKHTLFQCSRCDFKCTAERFLKAHVQRFHSEKGSYICDYCDKRYFTKDTLRVHIKRSHVNVKQTYICHVCGSVRLSEIDLKKHICESATAPDSNAEINVQNPVLRLHNSLVHPSSHSTESVLSRHRGLAEVGRQVPTNGTVVQSQMTSQFPLKENHSSTRLYYQGTSVPFYVNQTSPDPGVVTSQVPFKNTGYNGTRTQTEIVRSQVMSCAADAPDTPAGQHQGDMQVLAQDRLSLYVPLHQPAQSQGYPQPALHDYRAPAHLPLGWHNQHAAAGVPGPVTHAVQNQDAVHANSEMGSMCFRPESHPVVSSSAQVISQIPINQNYLDTFNLGYRFGDDEKEGSAGSASNFAISNMNNNSGARIMANDVWFSCGERVVDIFDEKGREYVNL